MFSNPVDRLKHVHMKNVNVKRSCAARRNDGRTFFFFLSSSLEPPLLSVYDLLVTSEKVDLLRRRLKSRPGEGKADMMTHRKITQESVKNR